MALLLLPAGAGAATDGAEEPPGVDPPRILKLPALRGEGTTNTGVDSVDGVVLGNEGNEGSEVEGCTAGRGPGIGRGETSAGEGPLRVGFLGALEPRLGEEPASATGRIGLDFGDEDNGV